MRNLVLGGSPVLFCFGGLTLCGICSLVRLFVRSLARLDGWLGWVGLGCLLVCWFVVLLCWLFRRLGG